MIKEQTVQNEIDHLFRQESGKMVSVLVKIFGTEHLELAEDVVQNTLLKALETWKYKGIPENPVAWLHRVAKNNTVDIIRREKRSQLFDFSDPEKQLLTSEYSLTPTINQYWGEDRIKDDFLAMIFASCHQDISSVNQVTFILKTLCGFSTKEIAKAFLTSEDIISKRIYRTKEHFRKNNIRPAIPSNDELEGRLAAVNSVIYLMFNEGYSSTNSNDLIRKDLISQSLFLCKALLDNPKTNLPEVNALMALMCLHEARFESRLNSEGEIVLLPDQDRKKWNKELIQVGRNYLEFSGVGNRISMYHFEAFIAFEHSSAPDYASTNWNNIVYYYEQMLNYSFDPVIYLNKCLAIMELKGAKEALEAIQTIKGNKLMEKYYLYHSALGEIYYRLGNKKKAEAHFVLTESLTDSDKEKQLVKKKIEELNLSVK